MAMIEKLADKHTAYTPGTQRFDIPVSLAHIYVQQALTEYRTEILKLIEQAMRGYVQYAKDAPEDSQEWAKTMSVTAQKITSELKSSIQSL